MLTEWKSTNSNPGPRNVLRNPLFYTSSLIVLALIYVGLVFFFRWEQNRELERKAEQKKAQEAQDAKASYEMLGGNRFEILNFYISPAIMKRGETAQLCYGVSNTKTVSIDPPVSNSMWPALMRCIPVEPKKDTAYTLTATDAAGNTKTAETRIRVE